MYKNEYNHHIGFISATPGGQKMKFRFGTPNKQHFTIMGGSCVTEDLILSLGKVIHCS